MGYVIARAIDDRLDLVLTMQPTSWPKIWAAEDDAELGVRLRRQLPLMRRGALGDVASDLQTILSKAPDLISQAATLITQAQDYLPTITAAVQDPSMPALIQRVQTLQTLTSGPAPAPTPAPTPGTTPAATGVGLNRVLPLFDAAIWYTKYPWAPWVIGAGVIITLGGAGFAVGRLTKRCGSKPTAGYRRKR